MPILRSASGYATWQKRCVLGMQQLSEMPVHALAGLSTACSYLVTRKDPLLTTTAFYEHGEWWDGPLCEWAWPEGMIVAWKPMPKPYNPAK